MRIEIEATEDVTTSPPIGRRACERRKQMAFERKDGGNKAMFDIEPRSESERWERKFESEIKRLEAEAVQDEQQSASDAAARPAGWNEAIAREMDRLGLTR